MAPQGFDVSARSCLDCHADASHAWAGSRHAAAFENAIFQASFAREPRTWCVNCHAPLPEQARGALRAEGVNCAACHLRDGVVLVAGLPSASGTAAHPERQERGLTDGALCAGCHQFDFPGTHAPMQNTVAEWKAWGRARPCVDCHSHALGGAHDEARVSEALELSATARGDEVDVAIALRGVGHRFPSGDPFRRLIVELCQGPPSSLEEGAGGCAVEAARVLRREVNPDTFALVREGAVPPQGLNFTLHAPSATHYRVEYRFAAPSTEAALAPWDTAFEVARGTIGGRVK
ncbi:MAG: cytochrome c family protein [Myxococcaceae bacterium]|nr:cytochrome c family protein [Myxococcaceae bacterium]